MKLPSFRFKDKALPSVFQLLRESAAEFWRNKRLILSIVAIVAVPLAVLGLRAPASADPSVTPDPSGAIYGSFATMFMNLALLWTVMRLGEGKKPGIRQAYYLGTAAAVRFILVALVLALSVVPLTVGAVIYISGVTGSTITTTLPEQLLLGLVWLLLAWPSAFFLTRLVFALFAVQTELTPTAALKSSWGLVKGKSWAVFGRLTALILLMVFVIGLAILVMTLAFPARQVALNNSLIQLCSTLVVLPLINFYLYRLYKSLSG